MTTSTIKAVVNRAVEGANSVVTATWAHLLDSDNGSLSAVDLSDWADRSIQVSGTFGGATLTVQGSNDGTNWATLNDTNQTALTFNGAGLKQINELTLHLRVITAGGGGTADITAVMFGHRINPLQW